MSDKASDGTSAEIRNQTSIARSTTGEIATITSSVGLNLFGGIVQEADQLSDMDRPSNEPEEFNKPEKPRSRAGTGDRLKVCGVCGDVAKSYHFGGLSCQSCKAFFRRSVQNDMYLRFTCNRGGRNCAITKTDRKTCQYCRMERCFEIGMEKRWVMNDDERRAFVKARTEKKSINFPVAASVSKINEPSASSSSSANPIEYVARVDCMIKYMPQEEINEIQSLVEKYVEAYKRYPYRSELHSGVDNRPGFQVMEMLGTVVKRFALYARMMPDFVSLSNQDQRVLLKGGVLEMCLLRGALAFDPVKNHWPNTDMSVYKDSPVLKVEDVTKMVSSAVIEKHIEFIRFVQKMGVDEATTMLLVMVVLFTSRLGLLQHELVESRQLYYSSLLKRYVEWRFGPDHSQKLFGKFLTKLSDLRELSESHNQQTLHFENEELFSIQEQLKDLKISPFPEFNVLGEENCSKGGLQQENTTSESQQHHQETSLASPPKHIEGTTIPISVANLAESIKALTPTKTYIAAGLSHHENPGTANPDKNLAHQQLSCSDMFQESLSKRVPHQMDYNQLSNPSQLRAVVVGESQMSNFRTQMTMQFMHAIHQSVDVMLDQPYSRVATSNVARSSEEEPPVSSPSLLFGLSSPPSLNPDDYEPSFGWSKEKLESDTANEGSTCNEEALAEEDVTAVEAAPHASERKLLEEICGELVKFSENFNK